MANISWNNGVSDGVAFNPIAGNVLYTVTATLAGCSSTDTVRVIIDSIPVITVNDPAAVCSPNTVDISGSASATIGTISFWNEASASSSLANETAVNDGKYFVKATNNDNAACFSIDSVNATVNITPDIALEATNPSACSDNDGSITITGLTSGVKYEWTYTNASSTVISKIS